MTKEISRRRFLAHMLALGIGIPGIAAAVDLSGEQWFWDHVYLSEKLAKAEYKDAWTEEMPGYKVYVVELNFGALLPRWVSVTVRVPWSRNSIIFYAGGNDRDNFLHEMGHAQANFEIPESRLKYWNDEKLVEEDADCRALILTNGNYIFDEKMRKK